MSVIGYYNRVRDGAALARVQAYDRDNTVGIEVYRAGVRVSRYDVTKDDAALVGEALRQYAEAAPGLPLALRRETIG